MRQGLVSADERCNGTPATSGSPKLTHEEIGQLCAATLNDEAEGAWAQSEVGEGVEEVWERSVSEYAGVLTASGTQQAASSSHLALKPRLSLCTLQHCKLSTTRGLQRRSSRTRRSSRVLTPSTPLQTCLQHYRAESHSARARSSPTSHGQSIRRDS